MNADASPKRPWLAAGLTLVVIGLGQAYLRRWGRAALWLATALLVGMLFVPEAALADPLSASPSDVLPVTLVGALSVIDAYLLAKRHNREIAVQNAERCPSCNRELEGDLTFCTWCATPLEESSETPSE